MAFESQYRDYDTSHHQRNNQSENNIYPELIHYLLPAC